MIRLMRIKMIDFAYERVNLQRDVDTETTQLTVLFRENAE
jgi:hypothetical protein